jgi:serine/threonine protein kinase
MQSDSDQSPGNSSDAGRGAPGDQTAPKFPPQATVAATLSSFRGLFGPPRDSESGRPAEAASDSTLATTGSVSLEPAQATAVGQMLGRYRIKKVLGSGSMGSVFLAHDPQLNREVALKVPRMEHDTAGELSQRLHREARAAATLSHPNICPIFDVTEEAGTCYIAMGYVAGKPLSAYLGKKAQPEREVAKVVRKIALALEEAHAQGIVHRDLKPANIMIDKRGEPIVMDFGVACWFDDETQTRLTEQRALVGTPAYMSPEQIEGHTKLGPASDIYSLGVVLHELLAGRCPFEGTVVNVISQVLYQTPPDPRKFRSDLSPGLVDIIQRAMQKDPSQRFPTMRDFAKALTALINGTSVEEEEDEEEKEPENTESPLPEAAVEPRPKRARRREEASSVALPPRSDVRARAKKKSKTGISLGLGVVAATTSVVLGVLIGAFLVGNRNTPKTSTSNQKPMETTELAAATGRVPTPASSTSPTPPPSSPAEATSAPNPAATEPHTPLGQNDRTSTAWDAARTSLAPATAASSSSAAEAQPAAPSSSRSSPRAQADVPQAAATSSSQPLAAPEQSRSDASRSVPAVPPTKDGGDPPDPPPPRRGSRAQPDDDNPPPPRAAGRVPFDGGPKRGTSIEQYFKKLDTNRDGRLDPTELPLHIIDRADTNKDGELTLSELKQTYKKRGPRLFSPPTAAEMSRLPQGGPPPENGRPPSAGPPGGGAPAQRTGGL